MQVSVLLLTFNEARNLPRCLAALDWCDDIVVIDSGSTDGTQQIASSSGARVLTRAFDDLARQRNFGLEHGHLRHQWVLHLDADEVVTDTFREQLETLRPPAGVDAFLLPSKLMLGDKWLRYSGMYPAYQVRLGHRERLRFVQRGHGQQEDLPAERLATFDEPYLHYSFSHGLRGWLEKHVRYAEAEAAVIMQQGKLGSPASLLRGEVARRRWLKALSNRLPFAMRPFARFIYVYIFRRGFLDGAAGRDYAMMLATYEAMISVFCAEKSDRNIQQF